ncbi:hypothetical protein LG325_13350 [Marinobacter nauticus]
MLEIIAVGDHYQTVDPEQGLENLKAAAAEVCRERFRRIDRFTQLALVGSARCVEDTELEPGAGLYIGSRFASLGNTTSVHEKMVSAGVVPKPASFINTLSNSAGYFVARNLRLSGRNLFVSRGDASIVAALQLAAMDVATGAVSQALVGSVDEAVLPLAHHRFRLGLEPDTDMGEGSHWLLVAPEGRANSLATITDMITLQDEAALAAWLDGLDPTTAYRVSLSPWTRQKMASTCLKSRQMLTDFEPGLAAYPGHATGAIIRYLEGDDDQPLLVIAADTDGRFHVIMVRPAPASA